MSEREFGGPMGRKYARIDLEGRKTLAKPEKIREFRYPESMEHMFHVVAQFDAESRREIQARILDRFVEMESELGVTFLIAGRDFVLHSTIQNGVCKKENRERESILVGELENSEAVRHSKQELIGLPLQFKYLLLDKGNAILTAPNIPQEIVEARKSISGAYAAKEFDSISMDNILHISLARMVGFPEGSKEKEAVFAQYKNLMVQLRHEISSSPISVHINAVVSGYGDFLITSPQSS